MANFQSSVATIIGSTVSGLGYELVDVEFAAGGLLRVFIDHPPASGQESIRIEDCEAVSHQLSRVLEVEGIDYARLEVSSPGLDRPLKRAVDFERFAGNEVAVRLKQAFGGRRNFDGMLTVEDGGKYGLEMKEGTKLVFDLAEIDRARLVPQLKIGGAKR